MDLTRGIGWAGIFGVPADRKIGEQGNEVVGECGNKLLGLITGERVRP